MVGLLHFCDLVLYKELGVSAGQVEDAVPVPHHEAAHVTIKLKPQEGARGEAAPAAYCVLQHGTLGGEAAPCGWVLEGLTSHY